MRARGQQLSTGELDEPKPLDEGVTSGLDVLGPYHLISVLAMGGMASVWLAVDLRSGREVAVKRMLPEVAEDEELRHSFTDEAALGLRLRHPNIIETIELGAAATPEGGEELHLVLELLRGRALVEVARLAARRHLLLPLPVVMSIVRDTARGLEHAHQMADGNGRPLDVVHRDVSPHNVFVCLDGRCKLLDFGICKANQQSHKSQAGTIKGKLAYLAPEQIRGQVLDARVDVFSLGVVLYELLTGQRLFLGSNDGETLSRVLDQPVPPPEQLRPDVPSAFGAIVMRALQRDRDRRLPSAGAFADSIDAVAAMQGIALGSDVVRSFITPLFPDDQRKHRERSLRAQRLYAYAQARNAADEEEETRDTTPRPIRIPLPRRPRPILRTALALCALSMTAFAAAGTARLVRRSLHSDTPAPPEIVVPPVSVPRSMDPPITLESPSAIPVPAIALPMGPSPRSKKPRMKGRPSDCAVYYSISKGSPTVVCGRPSGRASSPRSSRR